MPATTRSKTKQSRLEDFQTTESKKPLTPRTKTKKDSTSTKRKQSSDDKEDHGPSSPPTKKRNQKVKHESEAAFEQERKQSHLTESGNITASKTDGAEKPVIINRAPVLQLWSACVAQKLYPDLSWPTCLAVGSAISTLCAISKGRSIRTIDPPDTADGKRKERKEAQKRRDEAGADEEVLVMGFRLLLKGEDVLLQGKPKHGSEGTLKAKFGGDGDYARVRDAMADALATWPEGEEDSRELNKRAFHMYEAFRPSVQSGKGGWGHKGELSIEKIKEVVQKK